jgi:hypothetical protein
MFPAAACTLCFRRTNCAISCLCKPQHELEPRVGKIHTNPVTLDKPLSCCCSGMCKRRNGKLLKTVVDDGADTLAHGDHHPQFRVARNFTLRWRGTDAAGPRVARILLSCS